MSLLMVKPQTLSLMESFYTIQGEGAFTGSAAYFIRLGGCDVGCHWCDVKDSWEAANHPNLSVEEIVKEAGGKGEKIVVITGGEPLMYDLSELTSVLQAMGLRRHIETSGAHPLSGEWDWICFSPKKFKVPKDEFYQTSHELKVVIYNKSELAWAEGHAAKMHSNAQLFLQPEWSRAKEMVPLIVDYVKNNPKWRISLQTHKYLDIP
jgi:7-carboxy-7-deazaguanine synthase